MTRTPASPTLICGLGLNQDGEPIKLRRVTEHLDQTILRDVLLVPFAYSFKNLFMKSTSFWSKAVPSFLIMSWNHFSGSGMGSSGFKNFPSFFNV